MNQAEPKLTQSDREDEAEQSSSLSAKVPSEDLDNSQLDTVVGGSRDSNSYPINPQGKRKKNGGAICY